jgi:hypothetical protein
MRIQTPFTGGDLARIVTKADFPDTLYLSTELFGVAASMAKFRSADLEGEFVWMFRTKVRPCKYPERQEPMVVDFSESNVIFDVEYF